MQEVAEKDQTTTEYDKHYIQILRSLTFSELLLFFTWLFLCCGNNMNIRPQPLLSYVTLAAIAKL